MWVRTKLYVVAAAIGMAVVAPPRSARAADVDPTPVIKAKPIAEVPFFFINDNRLTYAYLFKGTQPGTYSGGVDPTNPGGSLPKQVFAYTHFDAWAYGTNYFGAILTKSNHDDPASPCILPGIVGLGKFFNVTATGNCAGATDIYGQVRSTFGFNQLFNTKAFSFGPLHNVSFEAGADVESYNGLTASAKRSFVAGLQFAFELPYKGYFNVAPLASKEFNHNAYTQCGDQFASPTNCNVDGNKDFNLTWAVEMNYYMDLGFLPENLQYFSVSGRVAFIGQKGSEKSPAFGTPTAIEVNSEPIRLTFDASKLIWGPKYAHFVDVWVAYSYWQNKYGYDHNVSGQCLVAFGFVPGAANTGACTESSLYTGVSVKF